MTFLEIIQAVSFFIAALLHGLTGMGFPMIATTAFAFMMPLTQAVAMVALPSLLMSALVLMTNNTRPFIDEIIDYLRRYWCLALMSVLGGFIGVRLLLVLPVAYLYLAMSAVTLYYAAQGLLSMAGKVREIRVPTRPLSMAIFGLVAGIIGGATNAMSPILLMFLFSQTDNKTDIAKASNLCYLLGKLVQIILLKDSFTHLNTSQMQWLGLLTMIAMLGLIIGVQIRRRLSVAAFRGLIFVILGGLAIKIGFAGIDKLVS